MVETGYYKHWKNSIYYVITTAIWVKDNNTQQRFVVYKPIDSDTIYARPIEEFEEFIDNEEGERVKRFKKLKNETPYIPPKTVPYGPYGPFTPWPPITIEPAQPYEPCEPYYPYKVTCNQHRILNNE